MNRLTVPELQSLQKFYGIKGVPYFSLVHNGVKFNEYVGVIQIGNTQIEVLPKADKNRNESQWRNVLIGMLRASGLFTINAPTSGDLRVRPNSILDLYFELFIREVEYLIHHGLSKRYRINEGNLSSYKGQVLFSKHISQNLVHQERVYSKHTVFDIHHSLHEIIFKTLKLVSRLNTSPVLQSRIGTLMLNFPEMADIIVSERIFERISLNRNTRHYQTALDISRLLLLNYHPDIVRGKNNVLALMFDMNLLWERFVYSSLQKELKQMIPSVNISAQVVKYFWKPESGYRTRVIPDIKLTLENGRTYILDTKWKNLSGVKPSTEDLRQLYVYHEYFEASKVAIIFPGESQFMVKGKYISPKKDQEWDKECSLIPVDVEDDVLKWKKSLSRQIYNWITESPQ